MIPLGLGIQIANAMSRTLFQGYHCAGFICTNRLGVVAWKEFFGIWNVDGLRIRSLDHNVCKKVVAPILSIPDKVLLPSTEKVKECCRANTDTRASF